MSSGTAFDGYEAVRHRLPAATAGGACRRAANLEQIADTFDVFLLDAFGVLNIGETAIPGVAERIGRLRQAGKRFMVLTNAASYTTAGLVGKYRTLGYDFAPEDVISSRRTLLQTLRDEPPRQWGIALPRAADRGDLGIDHLDLEDDAAAYDAVEGFLLLGSAEWTEARQRLLVAALRDRPRPVWVGNPDIVAPREHGFSIEPGHYAHRLADETGVTPRFFGKPFGNIFRAARARIGAGVAPERIVMVGDSLHTDILGAQAAGIGSALVTGYGFFAGQDAGAAIAASGIRPDFLLDQP
ncbi:HAD-IIA family hydrolase [Frigidibacter sp. ROC022]|uniref:HAD-IIA family hydrolase n=1 Tax=Frigidibacter sp. ROC022 TaxID=2971796 RepID=UPI00215A2600|nr:HAD-IIA family hydrolase [Frigidibacter sp. ROC022]MCR8726640.1 HAD-IIA family hydrolase [Frigidibacter sp. ROC022]